MLWELFQTHSIGQANWNALDAKFSAREAQSDARHIQRQVSAMEQQIERLTMATMAMAEILRDRLGITEEDIEAKMREIDLRDGQRDGKLRAPAKECHACQRTNGPRRQTCLYCGAELSGDSFLFAAEQPPTQ